MPRLPSLEWLLPMVAGRESTQLSKPAIGPKELDLRTDPGASDDERHNRARQLVGAHLARGEDGFSVWELAQKWANRCRPPLDPKELQQIVRSLTQKEQVKVARYKAGNSTGNRLAEMILAVYVKKVPPPKRNSTEGPAVISRHGKWTKRSTC